MVVGKTVVAAWRRSAEGALGKWENPLSERARRGSLRLRNVHLAPESCSHAAESCADSISKVSIPAANALAYWSAISQVVPVLALALVLEARALARRWSRPKALPRRRSRVLVAATFFVLSVGLTFAELSALGEIANPSKSPTFAAFNFYTSLLAVGLGVLIVISVPVSSIISILGKNEAPSVRSWTRLALKVDASRREWLELRVVAWNSWYDAEKSVRTLNELLASDRAKLPEREDLRLRARAARDELAVLAGEWLQEWEGAGVHLEGLARLGAQVAKANTPKRRKKAAAGIRRRLAQASL